MGRKFIRTWPLLILLTCAGWVAWSSPPGGAGGPLCVIFLMTGLIIVFDEMWQKLDAYEKQIRQLEEKVERLLVEDAGRGAMSAQESNAPNDTYYAPR